ncbi:rubredoxin [Methanobacterium sp. SMA-27]|nr:rubredoxin [Methanobacterium sp. SMA-27]
MRIRKRINSILPDDWRCPVCNSPKSVFVVLDEEKEELLN